MNKTPTRWWRCRPSPEFNLNRVTARPLWINIAFNVSGTVLPMAAALVAMPLLLLGMGTDRLGLFLLILGLFSFSGLLDLGLGRALTRAVAQALGEGVPTSEVAATVWSGLKIVLALGLTWGVTLLLLSDGIVAQLPIADSALRDDASLAVRILAAIVPVALVSSALVGALEGAQKFGFVNLVRAPLGVMTYAIPALISQYDGRLWVGALSVLGVRLLGMSAWGWVTLAQFAVGKARPVTQVRRTLWRDSGWLTVSNIVGPIMVSADRYLLAVMFPPAFVARYTVPVDGLVRLTALPGAALNALFPALARVDQDKGELRSLISYAGRGAILLWLMPILVFGEFLPALFDWWLGADFSAQVIGVARWILAGILLNGMSLIPFTILQARGRADITAKCHLFELVPYIILLLWWTGRWGIEGAAMAWTARVAFDGGLLTIAASRLQSEVAPVISGLACLSLTAVAVLLAGGIN